MFSCSAAHRVLILGVTTLLLASGGCSESAPERPQAAGTLVPDRRPAPHGPEYVDGTIPAGSSIRLTMTDTVGSATSHRGDIFRTTLNEAVVSDGLTVLPAGSVFQGIVERVTSAKESGSRGGSLVLAFKVVYTPVGTSGSVVAELSDVGKGGAAGNSLSLATLSRAAGPAAVVEGPSRRETVLAAGTPIAIVLTEPLTLKVEKKPGGR